VISALGGDDVIKGLGGHDILCGFDGNDRVLGGRGIDWIAGGDGNDVLIGGGGNDFLWGYYGDNRYDGGAGFDTGAWLTYNDVTADLSTGTATSYNESDTLVGIEGLESGHRNDSLTGDQQDNWPFGAEGDDVLTGGGGDDELQPSHGNDVVVGGDGFDLATWQYEQTFGITADLTLGTTSGEGPDMLVGIEALEGSSNPDWLIGDDADNALYGAGGPDHLDGGEGR
jgi:Ca2+-binding RTX toxin-like protein